VVLHDAASGRALASVPVGSNPRSFGAFLTGGAPAPQALP